MCDPDVGTTFAVYDRVVSVRLGTGVPIGTRGTIVGIIQGRLNLDTYYEVLFDNLSLTSMESILHGKNQQKCRIKVHSYHLLNYTHSLRIRSGNLHSQRSNPSEQAPRFAAAKPSNKTKSNTPKSAPPLATHEKPFFTHNNEQIHQMNRTQNPCMLSFLIRHFFIPIISLVMQQRMFYQAHEHPLLIQPPYPPQLTFQPMTHGWNNQFPGFAVRPMAHPVPVNHAPIQRHPANVQELVANSNLSCDAAPFQPRQPTTPNT